MNGRNKRRIIERFVHEIEEAFVNVSKKKELRVTPETGWFITLKCLNFLSFILSLYITGLGEKSKKSSSPDIAG